MKLTRRRFDESYFDGPLFTARAKSIRNQERLEAILDHKASGRLLEIGCGEGAFLRLASQSFEVEGVDVSPHAVAAVDTDLQQRVQVVDVQTEELPRSRYDVVAAFNVLEHLELPETAIERAARSLVPGGVFVGSVPLNGGLLGRFATAVSNLFDRTHVTTPGPRQWRRWFSQAGFERIEFFGEVLAGPHVSRYVRGTAWRYLGFNLMFVCQAPDRQTPRLASARAPDRSPLPS